MRVRRVVGLMGAMALVVAGSGCGGGGAELTEVSSPTAAFDPEVCAALDAETPNEEFVAAAPAEFRDAAQLLTDAVAVFDLTFELDADADSSSGAAPLPADLLASLTADGVAANLAGLADAIERTCGAGENVDGIRVFARAVELAEPPADPEYCVLLEGLTADASDAPDESWFTEAAALAPAEHRDALATLAAVTSGETPEDPPAGDAVAGEFAGIGLYAEARCGVDGAFSLMYFAGALVGLGLDTPDVPDSGEGADPVGDPSAAPPAADPTAANAAVPAGMGLIFEARTVALSDDGDYQASLLVPAGWEQSDVGFGASFEPSGDTFGFFTDIEADTGCDGLCQRTDWEARLTAPTGYLTSYRDTRTFTVDRPVEGSEGVVLVAEDSGFGVEGLVVRWNDGADKYFTCQFSLDDGDEVAVDAFVAACEGARPGWFPVS